MIDLNTIHKECKRIIVEKLFDNKQENFSVACKMYTAMVDDDECENCIGENFNRDLEKLVSNWFDSYTPGTDIEFYFKTYCLHLYLFYERIEFIFKVLNMDGKSKLFNDFRHHNFSKMTKITKWANFIKHPKEFMFTHYPIYYFEGVEIEKEDGAITVDTDFIFKYYMSEKNENPKILENKRKIYVEIPELTQLTKDFCDEFNVFVNFICDNKIVLNFLMKKSTIDHLYELGNENIEE